MNGLADSKSERHPETSYDDCSLNSGHMVGNPEVISIRRVASQLPRTPGPPQAGCPSFVPLPNPIPELRDFGTKSAYRHGFSL